MSKKFYAGIFFCLILVGCADSCNDVSGTTFSPPDELEVYFTPNAIGDVIISEMGCVFLDQGDLGDRTVEVSIDQEWIDEETMQRNTFPQQNLEGPLQQSRTILGGTETTTSPFIIAHPTVSEPYILSGTITMNCHCCCSSAFGDPNVIPPLTCEDSGGAGNLIIAFEQEVVPGINSDGIAFWFDEIYISVESMTIQPCENCGCSANEEECS